MIFDVRNTILVGYFPSAQYRRFMRAEHFYRPIYAHENKWQFRVSIWYIITEFFIMANRITMLVIAGGYYRTYRTIMSVIIRSIIVTIIAP